MVCVMNVWREKIKMRSNRNDKKRAGKVCRKLMVCLCAVMLVTGGCSVTGGKDQTSGQDKTVNRIKVVATLFPYYDFARQVGGKYADVSLILPAGMDTHSFEPTAADMIRMGQADLILYNGGENEQWVGQVLESADNKGIMADEMMKHVDTLVEEHVEGMQEEKGEEHDHEEHGKEDPDHNASKEEEHDHDTEETLNAAGEIDEHIWTSPVNAQKIVAQIAKDFAKLDPEHREEYQKNAQRYMKKLNKLDKDIRQVTSHAKHKYLAFADRFPLRYFVEEYGLDYTAAFAGCSSDTEPSAETITYLTRQVKDRRLPVVLKIELTSDKVAKAVAEAASTKDHHVKVETFYTCHNVTRKQFDAGETYVSLMEKNVKVLREALEE